MSEKEFLKYPSLVNHYAITRNRAVSNQLNEIFYATEKIHGSNMSFHINLETNEITYASRNRVVNVLDSLGAKLIKLSPEKFLKQDVLKDLLETYTEIKFISVYGELYGAGIQSMDYKENKESKVDFKVFSVILQRENEYVVLGLKELQSLFDEDKLVPMFYENKTLDELLKLDLPKDSKLGGHQEGLVYKPVKTFITFADNPSLLAVKHKHEDFEEKKTNKKGEKVEVSGDVLQLTENLKLYVTENRLNNILSKGDLSLNKKNIGKLIQAFQNDIAEEVARETDFNLELVPQAIKRINPIIAHLILNKIEE